MLSKNFKLNVHGQSKNPICLVRRRMKSVFTLAISKTSVLRHTSQKKQIRLINANINLQGKPSLSTLVSAQNWQTFQKRGNHANRRAVIGNTFDPLPYKNKTRYIKMVGWSKKKASFSNLRRVNASLASV